MDKETLYDLIDRYTRKELTDEETQQVSSLLLNDPGFAKELKLHTEIQAAVADKNLLAFRQTLVESYQHYSSNTVEAKKQKSVSLYLKIAASVLLMVSLAAFFLLTEKPSSNQELFEAYFTPYEAPVNFRSDTSPYEDEDWKQALVLYDNKQYAEAITYLNKVVENKPGNTLAVFLRGISYLAMDSTAMAEQDFNLIVAQESNLFKEQAQWYLALGYLKQGKTTEARELLYELGNKNTDSRAFELWKRLE